MPQSPTPRVRLLAVTLSNRVKGACKARAIAIHSSQDSAQDLSKTCPRLQMVIGARI